MKQKQVIIILLAISFGLIFSQNTASAAAIAFSSTSVDWSQFYTSSAVDYYDQYSIPIAEATANGYHAPQVRNDLRSWGSVSSTNTLTNTEGYGYTTEDLVYAEGNAMADGINTVESFGSSHISRGGYFTVPSALTLNLSVPYAFYHDVLLESAVDSGYGYSMINLWLGEQTGPGQTLTLASKQIAIQNVGNINEWSLNGILTLDAGVDIVTGKQYVFDIAAYASASANTTGVVPQPVPEPATMSLLGLGLLGLLKFKGKK